MTKIASFVLMFCVTLVMTMPARSQSSITMQWSYAGTSYPSEQAAVAAMQAASPSYSVLTQQLKPNSMSSGAVQYPYVAPSPLPATQSTVYWGGGPYETSEAAALLYEEENSIPSEYQNSCGSGFATPNGAPVYSADLGPPSYGPGYNQHYNFTWWDYDVYSHPQCQQITSTNALVVSYWQAYACPTYYTLSGTNCIDGTVQYITATPLVCTECAAPGTSTLVGDPIDALSGDFTRTELDYVGAHLSLTRYYHSATLEPFHGIGVGWTHNYAASLLIVGGAPQGLLRPDGHHDPLIVESGSFYETVSGDNIHVQASGSNWAAYMSDGSEEIYNSSGVLIKLVSPGGAITTLNYTGGLLTSIVGPFGHTLTFAYNASNTISSVTDPAGKMITYSYDSHGNLASVVYQDGTNRTYQYTNTTLPNSLTGILDESGIQFLAVSYDSDGRASSAQDAGGANSVSLAYNTTSATATDGLGGSTVFGFVTNTADTARVTTIAHNGLTTTYLIPSRTVDWQLRATQMTDANGNITQFAYSSDYLTSKTEALGTSSARTTSYQYLSTLDALPTLITEPLRQTSFTYFSGTNNLETKTITDTTVTPNASRTWTYTYNSYGQVLTAKGPRTDLNSTTSYTYYTCTSGIQCGEVETITDALGHITTFSTYNTHGQPLTVTDPNGVVTTLTYDLRRRLTSRQIGSEMTSYSYYPTGLLETVTLPDLSTITYTYDGAHRLTDITDGLGDHIHYTLDNMGNRTAENTYDPSSTLKRTHTRVINTLNELSKDVNAAGTAAVTTTLTYDNNGNVLSSAAPLSRNTSDQYDALNRLTKITDPNAGITQLTYDANDNLASVKDPRNLTTTYSHNGFGDVTQLVSPDTGTSSSTFDSGGNLKTTTDARGAVGTYAYDALNRVTQVAYTDQTINFTYDGGTNGVGRLTGASDANHSLSWTYDALGRVTGKGQTVGTTVQSVGYAYSNGDLITLITPSGQTVAYGYTNHRITSVSVNGTTILSGVAYDPFGPANAWTWGNATTVSRTFDEDGNPSTFITAGVTNGYTVDSASRITAISDSGLSSNSWTFGYDLLDRVNSGVSSAITEGYTYDANSNRLTTTGAVPSTETIATTSNQLSSTTGSPARTYSYDAAGNTLAYATNTYTFNQRGRMSEATVAGGVTSYLYNALGQLVSKSGSAGTTLLVYDEAGHILGEYTGTGALIQETIWMGDTPIATLQPNGGSVAIYYVHTDHLGTPRKITRPSDNGLMWRWDPDTFGGVTPNTNPAGLGVFNYNLRFPGQYYQAETGLMYNYFRDYDPQMGRYTESDPVGLAGGRNTYIYVKDNPISRTDRRGLGGPGVAGTGVDGILQNTPDSKCDYWPALCVAKVIVCTEATCTYTDCHGKPFVMEGVSFLPTPPNRAQLAKESPNCKCTKWKAFNDE